MFSTKFKLSADRIQLLKVISGLGFTLRHWHSILFFVNDLCRLVFTSLTFWLLIVTKYCLKRL